MLTANKLKNIKPQDRPYKLYDSLGLFLLVKPNGRMFWRMRYRNQYEGKVTEKTLSFGVFPETTLTQARLKRDEARGQIKQGYDPTQQVKENRRKTKIDEQAAFEVCFRSYWKLREQKGYCEKTEAKLLRLIETNALSKIGHLRIDEITTQELLTVFDRLLNKGSIDSAQKLRQKISAVYGHAIALGITQINLADNIRNLLPSKKTAHHPAFTKKDDVKRLMIAIDCYPHSFVVKAALKLLALWFLRSVELRHTQWSEIDFDKRILTIPGTRTKTKTDLIVPICSQAIDTLEELKAHSTGNYILPSLKNRDQPLSDMAIWTALRCMGFDKSEHSPHGFRAMARTLLDEELEFPVKYIEMQLGHKVRGPLGETYNRTKYLRQRTEMMSKWGDYLEGLAGV